MILASVILLPFTGIVLWLYFHLAPQQARRSFRLCYDSVVVVFCALLACLAVSLYAYRTVGIGVDRAWWPLLAVLYSLCVFPIVVFPILIIIGGLVRHFSVFRAKC